MKRSLWNEINTIYTKLSDEESRFIFKKRLQYSLDNTDAGPIRDIAVREEYDGKGTMRTLIINSEKYFERELVIFGAVRVGEVAKMNLEGLYGFKNVVAFCDNDKDKQGKMLGGAPVISVEEACKSYSGAVYLVVAVYHFEEIKEQLLSLGVSEDNIFVREIPADVYGLQYFDKKLLSDQVGGVFIDGGSLDLENSIQFLSLFPDAKKAYAFEPNRENYKYCLKRLENTECSQKIEIVNKGLFDSEGEIHFKNDKGCSSITEDGDETIQTISIDCFMKGKEKVSLIKMDIEGAELAALEGAREVIKRDRPDLAICVYHKNSDILDILQQILDINPDYRLFLRHYSESGGETVVYAVE